MTNLLEGSLTSVLAAEPQFDGEESRFLSILRRHVNARGGLRRELRQVLVEYLRFSPNRLALVNDLITYCVGLALPERLDVAIDVLSQLDELIYDYAFRFHIDDLERWGRLYPGRAYKPNDDYWYVLLRSVARANVRESRKLRFIMMSSSASSRGVVEGVVEALADVETADARSHLQSLCNHSDPFIKKLAKEALAQC